MNNVIAKPLKWGKRNAVANGYALAILLALTSLVGSLTGAGH